MNWRAAHILLLLLLLAGSAKAQVPTPAANADAQPDDEVTVEAPPDERIQTRVESVLRHIEAFDEVAVTVRDGVAILTGEVDDAQARDDAAELVGRFEGVIWVDSRLEVATDVETRISPALERLERFGNRFIAYLPIGLVILLLIVLLWKLGSMIGRWEAPAQRFGWNPLVWGLIRRMARMVLVLGGLLLIFDILGVSALVGALLGTAGIVGLALGIAFQDIAENYLAGILMSIRQPFNVNDIVRIDEYEGFIVRLTSRELVMLTLEGNHVRMPNSAVFKSTIVNYTRNPRRLFNFELMVESDEDLSEVASVARDLLNQMPGVLPDPAPFVRVMEVTDAGVRVRFNAWVDQRDVDFGKIKSEAIRIVKTGLEAEGIALTHTELHVTLSRDHPPRKAPASFTAPSHADVAPDQKMSAQVEEDLAGSDEENLLE